VTQEQDADESKQTDLKYSVSVVAHDFTSNSRYSPLTLEPGVLYDIDLNFEDFFRKIYLNSKKWAVEITDYNRYLIDMRMQTLHYHTMVDPSTTKAIWVREVIRGFIYKTHYGFYKKNKVLLKKNLLAKFFLVERPETDQTTQSRTVADQDNFYVVVVSKVVKENKIELLALPHPSRKYGSSREIISQKLELYSEALKVDDTKLMANPAKSEIMPLLLSLKNRIKLVASAHQKIISQTAASSTVSLELLPLPKTHDNPDAKDPFMNQEEANKQEELYSRVDPFNTYFEVTRPHQFVRDTILPSIGHSDSLFEWANKAEDSQERFLETTDLSLDLRPNPSLKEAIHRIRNDQHDQDLFVDEQRVVKKLQGWYRYWKFVRERNNFKRKAKGLGALGQRQQLIGLKEEGDELDLTDTSSQLFISTCQYQTDQTKTLDISVFFDIKFNKLVLKAVLDSDASNSPSESACAFTLAELGIDTRNIDEIQDIIHETLEAHLSKVLCRFPSSHLKTTPTPKNSSAPLLTSKPSAPQPAIDRLPRDSKTESIRDLRLSSMALIFQIRSFTMLKKIKVLAADPDPLEAQSQVCGCGEEAHIEDLLRERQQRLHHIRQLLQDQLQPRDGRHFAREQH